MAHIQNTYPGTEMNLKSPEPLQHNPEVHRATLLQSVAICGQTPDQSSCGVHLENIHGRFDAPASSHSHLAKHIRNNFLQSFPG